MGGRFDNEPPALSSPAAPCRPDYSTMPQKWQVLVPPNVVPWTSSRVKSFPVDVSVVVEAELCVVPWRPHIHRSQKDSETVMLPVVSYVTDADFTPGLAGPDNVAAHHARQGTSPSAAWASRPRRRRIRGASPRRVSRQTSDYPPCALLSSRFRQRLRKGAHLPRMLAPARNLNK